jgi:hypothetical protein
MIVAGCEPLQACKASMSLKYSKTSSAKQHIPAEIAPAESLIESTTVSQVRSSHRVYFDPFFGQGYLETKGVL